MVSCSECSRRKKVSCGVCHDDRILQYASPHSMPGSADLCVCPMCDGSGLQSCLNCLGVGETFQHPQAKVVLHRPEDTAAAAGL
ncbi:MAG: hypothetical protein WDW38_010987 [Sanguina aurantia]